MLHFVIAFHRSVDSLPKFPHLVLWLGLVSSPYPLKRAQVLITAARMLAAQIRLLVRILSHNQSLLCFECDGEYVRKEIRSRRSALSRAAVKLEYGSGRC